MSGGPPDKFRLPASLLTPAVDPARLGFTDTSQVLPLEEHEAGSDATPLQQQIP